MKCIGHFEEGKDLLIFEIENEYQEMFDIPLEDARKDLYAFYVFYNEKRIITRWYETSNKVEVKSVGEGLYYAVGFVKENDMQPTIMVSPPMQVIERKDSFELPPVSFSIFGSCVSRDLLEYDEARNVKLDLYFARQSIVSAVSAKVPITLEEINLKSNFQKRQIYYDFNKTAFQMIKENVSDFLFLDLVDERFSLVNIGNSYVTRSSTLLESGVVPEDVSGVDKVEYVDEYGHNSYQVEGIDIRVYLDRFCNKILESYKSERIILHVVRGAEYYCDVNGNIQKFEPNVLGYFKRLNRMWSFMYDYLYKKMTDCIYIDISSGYLADEKHVWGLSPIHFQKEYYEKVLEEINKVI